MKGDRKVAERFNPALLLKIIEVRTIFGILNNSSSKIIILKNTLLINGL